MGCVVPLYLAVFACVVLDFVIWVYVYVLRLLMGYVDCFMLFWLVFVLAGLLAGCWVLRCCFV